MHRVVESLARIQEHAGTVFPVPANLSAEELEAGLWLDGERTRFTWDDLRLSFDLRTADVDLQVNNPTGALMLRADATLEIRDHMLHLGTVATHFHAARATNLKALAQAAARGDDSFDVTYEPAGDNTATRWLEVDQEDLSA